MTNSTITLMPAGPFAETRVFIDGREVFGVVEISRDTQAEYIDTTSLESPISMHVGIRPSRVVLAFDASHVELLSSDPPKRKKAAKKKGKRK